MSGKHNDDGGDVKGDNGDGCDDDDDDDGGADDDDDVDEYQCWG